MDIDRFTNPYSGKPRGGFIVTIADSNKYAIQTMTVSLKVSTFTTLDTAVISRNDQVSTVGELS